MALRTCRCLQSYERAFEGPIWLGPSWGPGDRPCAGRLLGPVDEAGIVRQNVKTLDDECLEPAAYVLGGCSKPVGVNVEVALYKTCCQGNATWADVA